MTTGVGRGCAGAWPCTWVLGMCAGEEERKGQQLLGLVAAGASCWACVTDFVAYENGLKTSPNWA